MPDLRRTVGIDIGGTFIKIAAVWEDGRVLASRAIPTDVDRGPAAAVERIVATAREVMQAAGLQRAEMRAIGIDSAGIVDAQQNLVLDAPNLRSWEGYPLADQVGEALGLPAFLENDVNAMAYAEWRLGAGRGTRHLLCLTLGTGVGGGLILNGELYRGARGAGGEVGHMTIEAHGPRCNCGSYGCLERYVGAQYIVERAVAKLGSMERPSLLREILLDQLSPLELSRAALAGDAIAAEVLEETGEWLGIGLASLANILNPERIVVGGGVARAGDLILAAARRTLLQRAMSIPAESAEVVPAALGNDASLVGAALLALERAQDL